MIRATYARRTRGFLHLFEYYVNFLELASFVCFVYSFLSSFVLFQLFISVSF